MRIVVTGAAGLLGSAMVREFLTKHEVTALNHQQGDITRPDELRQALAAAQPDVIIHTAAIPDLDVCEADPALAYLVNVHGTRHIVEEAKALGAALVHISTDAVFDGLASQPYHEDSETRPPTVYGRTKLRGELLARTLSQSWILRIPVLFGPGKTNFIEKGLRRLAAGEKYAVASDQIGGALYTVDAARTVMQLVEAHRYGLYHLANRGACTRFDLARMAAGLAGLEPGLVQGVPAAAMGRRAVRLQYAVMDMDALSKVGIPLPRPWQDALREYVQSLKL